MIKIYRGHRDKNRCNVTANGEEIDPRTDLLNLSSSGFEWGYDGGGPGQLALAILADFYDDDSMALTHYKTFSNEVIANLRGDEWMIDHTTIKKAMSQDYVVKVPMTLDELIGKLRGDT